MIFITRLIIFNTLLFGASLNASDNFENYEIRFDISFPLPLLKVQKNLKKLNHQTNMPLPLTVKIPFLMLL